MAEFDYNDSLGAQTLRRHFVDGPLQVDEHVLMYDATATRDVCGEPIQVAWREQIKLGVLLGPTNHTTGPAIVGKPRLWPGLRIVCARAR